MGESPEVWSMLADLDTEEPVDFEEFISRVTEPLGDHFSKAGTRRMMGLLGDEVLSAGSIGPENLSRMAEELGIEMDERELEELLEKAGANAQGRIDLDDFYAV